MWISLRSLAVSHVTLTINAVDPAIGAQIYAWIRDGKRPFRGETAARILLDRQLESIRLLHDRGILVKVNSIIIPGVNDDHIADVAATVSRAGADILNAIPIFPVSNTPFASLDPPTAELMARVREQAAAYLPLMHHCTRCRADAAGLLGEALSDEHVSLLCEAAGGPSIQTRTGPLWRWPRWKVCW